MRPGLIDFAPYVAFPGERCDKIRFGKRCDRKPTWIKRAQRLCDVHRTEAEKQERGGEGV